MEAILEDHNEPHYYYNYSYQTMFPHLFLRQKAAELGYKKKDLIERTGEGGEHKMFVYEDTIGDVDHDRHHETPIEIDGVRYSMSSETVQNGWKAMVDDDGKAVLVNMNVHQNIVEIDGKLKYEKEINEWD